MLVVGKLWSIGQTHTSLCLFYNGLQAMSDFYIFKWLRRFYDVKVMRFRFSVCMNECVCSELVKNPPAMQETPVRFLGREAALEKPVS